jgi:hypothetical protein
MKRCNSKQIMSHLQLTDEQKSIAIWGVEAWQRLPWVKLDKLWTCEFLQIQSETHPLSFPKQDNDLAIDVLEICKTACRESPAHMRTLSPQVCRTPGCYKFAKEHRCTQCGLVSYCRSKCMKLDQTRHTFVKHGNNVSECAAMCMVVQSWEEWQTFIIQFTPGKHALDVLDMVYNPGDQWLRSTTLSSPTTQTTAKEDLLCYLTKELLLYQADESPAASGARHTLSNVMKRKLNKWQTIHDHLVHMPARSAAVFFRDWFDEVPWGKSKLLRLAASVSAAATETKLAELRAVVAAAAERERVSITQRAEEQKQHQALQSRLAEVHLQLAEQKKQRSEEQHQLAEEKKQRAEEQQQRAEEQRLLADVHAQRAATQKEILRTQKQLGRLQTRLETSLAAERDAASALAASVSAAAGTDIFDTEHCAVCFGEHGYTVDTALIPCGHTFCRQCAETVLSLPKRECHTCRGAVTGVLRLFKD